MAAQTSQTSSKTAAAPEAADENTRRRFEASGGPQPNLDPILMPRVAAEPDTTTKVIQISSRPVDTNAPKSFHATGGPQMDIDDDDFISEDEDILSEIDVELGPFRPTQPYETRANHFVSADSEDFQDIESYYKSLLNTPKLTIKDVLEGCFNDHEISLITPQTSPPALVRWQYHNALRYRQNLKTRFQDRKSTNEFKMACLYFGLPVEPIHISSEPWEPSPAHMVDEMAEPNIDPLKFLQEYDEKFNYPQPDGGDSMHNDLFGLRGGGDTDVSDSEYDDDIYSMMSLDSVEDDELAAPPSPSQEERQGSQLDTIKSLESRLPAPQAKLSRSVSQGTSTNPASTTLFGTHTKADELPGPTGRQPAPPRQINGSRKQPVFGSGVGSGFGRASPIMPEVSKLVGGLGPREKMRRLIADDKQKQAKITAPDVNALALQHVFKDSKNDNLEATRREVLRERAFWTSESIFTNPQKPVMPLHGPPLESIIKTGPSMPGVSIAMMTPTEMARLQREVHSLRGQLLDRIRTCPYHDCERYFPFSDGAGLDMHVREEHSVMRCFLCNEEEHLIPYYNADRIKQHFQNVHLNQIVSSFGGRDGRINNLEDLIGDSSGLEHYCDRCGRDQFALGHPADRSAHSDKCFTRATSDPPKPENQKFCGHCASSLELTGKDEDGRLRFSDPCLSCFEFAHKKPQKFCTTCTMKFDENMDQNYRVKHTKMCRPVSGRNWDYCPYCGSDLRNLQEPDRKRHAIFCEHKPKNDHASTIAKGRKPYKSEKRCELFSVCGALITHMSPQQIAAHMDCHRRHGDLRREEKEEAESTSYHKPSVESDEEELESVYHQQERKKGGEDLVSYTKHFQQYLDEYIPRGHRQTNNDDEWDMENIGRPGTGMSDVDVNFFEIPDFHQKAKDLTNNATKKAKKAKKSIKKTFSKKNTTSQDNAPEISEPHDEELRNAEESGAVDATDAQSSAAAPATEKARKGMKTKKNKVTFEVEQAAPPVTEKAGKDRKTRKNKVTFEIDQVPRPNVSSHPEGTSSLWTQNTDLIPDPALTRTTVKTQALNPLASTFVPKPETGLRALTSAGRRFPLVPGPVVTSPLTFIPDLLDKKDTDNDPTSERAEKDRSDRKGKGREAVQSTAVKKPSPKKNRNKATSVANASSSPFGKENPEPGVLVRETRSGDSSRMGTPEIQTTTTQVSLATTKTSSEPAGQPPVEYEEAEYYTYRGETKVTLPPSDQSGTRTLLPDDELFTARWPASRRVTGAEDEMEANIAYFGARDLNIDLIQPAPDADAALANAHSQARRSHINEMIETAKRSQTLEDVRALVKALVRDATQQPDGAALAAQVLEYTGKHINETQALEYAATPDPDSSAELATPDLSEDQPSEHSDSTASLSANSLSTNSHASSDATYDPSRPFPTIASLSSKRKRKRPADIDPQYRKKSVEPDTDYEYSEKSAVPDPVKNIALDAQRSPKKRATRKKNVTIIAGEGEKEEVKGDMGPPPLPAKAVKAKAEKEKKGPTVTRTGRTVKKTRAAKEANGEESTEPESEIAPARGKGRGKK
ncbi:hypothetical protein F5Y18DRAFT_429631 [Xylariaceae sp. FL1019]|nr:hypothetical protein F5Y18DRAFT_429631 [Xylariaceae sp. FL1019]